MSTPIRTRAEEPDEFGPPLLDGECRVLLDQVLDKWSVLVLAALCHGPLRFNELRRHLDGVTQKSLTQALRRLERNGIVDRTVTTASPVAVQYRITALGRTLDEPFTALRRWTSARLPEVVLARERFDVARDPGGLGRKRPDLTAEPSPHDDSVAGTASRG